MTYSCSRNKVLGGPYSEKRGMICLIMTALESYISFAREIENNSLCMLRMCGSVLDCAEG